MAERRMFAKSIIDSDLFLDMPISSQCLYFHLGIRADDDGFVNNPKKISKMINANDDDMRILLVKKFIINFESGVIVISHWRLHNYIQKDRYKPTNFCREKALLGISENNVYTLATERIQVGYAGKDRLGKVSIKPSLLLSPVEKIDFKTFKNQLIKNCPNFSFNLQGKLGYSYDHIGFCLTNGYLFDVNNNKLLDKNESFEIWRYLYSVKDKVYELAKTQNHLSEEVINEM